MSKPRGGRKLSRSRLRKKARVGIGPISFGRAILSYNEIAVANADANFFDDMTNHSTTVSPFCRPTASSIAEAVAAMRRIQQQPRKWYSVNTRAYERLLAEFAFNVLSPPQTLLLGVRIEHWPHQVEDVKEHDEDEAESTANRIIAAFGPHPTAIAFLAYHQAEFARS